MPGDGLHVDEGFVVPRVASPRADVTLATAAFKRAARVDPCDSMCIFFGQDGTLRYHYRTYGVEEVVPYEPQLRARPNNLVNVVVAGARGPGQTRANWGFRTGRFDWNARDDRLASSPLWRQMWRRPGHHVVVPMSRAYEATTRYGRRRWFAVKRHDQEPLLVPGLGRVQPGPHRTEWHVSLVTVDSGPVFAPIHDTPREVVCLRDWGEARAWLAAADETRLRALLRPADEQLLESYRVHDDVFKESFPAERCAEPYRDAKTGLGAFGA